MLGFVSFMHRYLNKMEVVKNALRFVYSEQVLSQHYKIIKQNCNGCITSHGSQDQHMCCFPEQCNDNVDWYRDAENQVDKSKVKLIFTIMGHQLHLNTKCLDIDAELHRILLSWQMNDFQELEMNAPNEWVTAMDVAISRIELLERRLRGWNLRD